MNQYLVTTKPLKVSGDNVQVAKYHARILLEYRPLKLEIDQIMPWPENQGQHLNCTIEAIPAKEAVPSGSQQDGEKVSEQGRD